MINVKQLEDNLNALIEEYNELQMEIHQANLQYIVLEDNVYKRFTEIEEFLLSYIW